ncbi:PAS domain-containing protein [Natronocalculus amylovorans]|uniref:histidine kinase n=1 Tax=Natronocalculus amylovorans TaxID=2917812 RepID=A0AAE3G169_9EURY|nr:PAS domain-containing protein [Natronocalculus amylovorans]
MEWDTAYKLVRINKAARNIFAYTTDELQGADWEKVLPPLERNHVTGVFASLQSDHQQRQSINLNLTKGGSEIMCEWHNHALTNAEGDRIAIYSHVYDITDNLENKRQLEGLVDRLPGIVYRHQNEPGWPLAFVKGSCVELTGYTSEELADEVLLAEEIIHPDDRTYVQTETEQSLAEHQSYNLTYRIRMKSGVTKWIWECGGKVTLSNGDSVLEGFLISVDTVDLDRLSQFS